MIKANSNKNFGRLGLGFNFMTSKPGSQTIAAHMLLNISQKVKVTRQQNLVN